MLLWLKYLHSFYWLSSVKQFFNSVTFRPVLLIRDSSLLYRFLWITEEIRNWYFARSSPDSADYQESTSICSTSHSLWYLYLDTSQTNVVYLHWLLLLFRHFSKLLEGRTIRLRISLWNLSNWAGKKYIHRFFGTGVLLFFILRSWALFDAGDLNSWTMAITQLLLRLVFYFLNVLILSVHIRK